MAGKVKLESVGDFIPEKWSTYNVSFLAKLSLPPDHKILKNIPPLLGRRERNLLEDMGQRRLIRNYIEKPERRPAAKMALHNNFLKNAVQHAFGGAGCSPDR
jgi:hypothetical protein